MSNMFEHLVSVRLGRFMECRVVNPITQFVYKKGLGPCDAILCVEHTLLSSLVRRQEAGILQVDFSAAFDRANHQGILLKLCSVGVGGSALSVMTVSL